MDKAKSILLMDLLMKAHISMERKMASVKIWNINFYFLGRYILNAQSSYEGNFKDDKMHGHVNFMNDK